METIHSPDDNSRITLDSHSGMPVITFSRNLFLPLTFVCRNSCGYCTFRKDPDPECLIPPSDVETDPPKGGIIRMHGGTLHVW